MNKNIATGITIVAIILVITLAGVFFQKSPKSNNAENSVTTKTANPNSTLEEATATYKDGVYDVVGDYISPGGAETIGVKLTLENGIITDSEVEVQATREISVEKQTDFSENYKELVIGKNIDDIELTKVSGSSLTPKGFNDAVEKIKTQAQS